MRPTVVYDGPDVPHLQHFCGLTNVFYYMSLDVTEDQPAQ